MSGGRWSAVTRLTDLGVVGAPGIRVTRLLAGRHGAWIKDLAGRLLAANETYARALGLTARELVGRLDVEVLGRHGAQRDRRSDVVVLDRGRPVLLDPLPNEKDSGWYSTLKLPLWVPCRSPGAVAGVARRLGDWRVIDDALRRLAHETEARPAAWLRETRAALDAGFRKPVRVARLAAAVQVHPDHLARSFRHTFGLAIAQYVRTRRVIWAAESLETAGQPIADVALEAGFCDQSHLTRSFRSVLGTSPAAFRRRTSREPWVGIPRELVPALLATPSGGGP